MLNGGQNFQITSQSVQDWMIDSEPELVRRLHSYYTGTESPLSFDSDLNRARLSEVSAIIEKNAESIYRSLGKCEKFLVSIMHSGFGWIVYENIESTLHILSKIFRLDAEELKKAMENLFSRYLLFKFERLKRYNFLFSPPVFLRCAGPFIADNDILGAESPVELKPEEIGSHQYISLIAGLISYIITNSPRSSESNEIHKIDMTKMLDFFADFSDPQGVENIIKKLSRFGFFQKVNNRIVINKSLFDTIVGLSVNEQLFIIHLYDFMARFDFKQSAFMTLKNMANWSRTRKHPIALRALFFFYLNNEIYVSLKNEPRNMRLMVQQEELKFLFFLKNLEMENIVKIHKANGDKISIGTDCLVMNEPHGSLLTGADYSNRFQASHFIVEPNFEIIAEPYIHPSVLFRLALMTEPQTIQTMSIFKITKESIYRSFAYGVKKEDVIPFLREHSEHAIPDNVTASIESFIKDLSVESMENYRIIQVSAHHSGQVRDHFKNRLIEVEPHTFIVFERELSDRIAQFCKENKITCRFIENFLDNRFFDSLSGNTLDHNIKHLHKMQNFFDFYGSLPAGGNIKIDNHI